MSKSTSDKLPQNNKIMQITETDLQDKIYTIRGQKVMLDYDLAKIYGYTTSAFNQQVTRNIEKFEGEDFMFQLTREEAENHSRSQIVTLNESCSRSKNLTLNSRRGQNIKYLPYAFTEQGIYMLMTVLKGPLAVKQSRALIMMFKTMKDYVLETQNIIREHNNLSIITRVVDNTKDILKAQNEIKIINTKVDRIASEMDNMVKKSDLPPIFLDFNRTAETREYLLLNGEPIRAKDAYLEIYKLAKSKIYIIDNYISIKTLHLLQIVKRNLEITFFTDNTNKYLRKTDLDDFKTERSDLKINFIKTSQTIHDRFIILDEERIYQSGGSSKDLGNRLTSIHEINDEFIKQTLLNIIQKLKQNPKLILK